MMGKLAFGLLVGLTFSCGNSGGTTVGGGDGSEASRFIDEFATLLCDLAAQCCVPSGFTAPNDCANQAKSQLHGELDKEVDGGLRFDAQAGEKCMAAYRTLAPSCPAYWDSPQFNICKNVFFGSQPPGSSCAGGCAPSDQGRASCLSYSSIGPDGGITESGQICQVVITAAPGEACDPNGRLAVERHCDSPKNSNCVQGVCSTPKSIGAACTNNYDCVPEAMCTAGTCVPRIPVGGACTGSDCLAPAVCQNSRCVVVSRWKKTCSGDFN